MPSLFDVFLVLLFATALAWLWHGHGIRERALFHVRRHCQREGVELLDDAVAFRRFGLIRDSRGRRRFARLFAFEFTVTGEQRHSGEIVMFGGHPGPVEMAPHPCPAAPTSAVVSEQVAPAARVIQLSDWRREHPRKPTSAASGTQGPGAPRNPDPPA